MTTFKAKAEFVGKLSGLAIDGEKQQKHRDARASKAQELLGDGFLPTDREQMRNAMSFSIKSKDGKKEYESMDERGQRKSIETEDARTRYQSIDPKDYAKVQKALEKIIKIKEKMLSSTDEEGNALFEEADLMTELFTPLVREGLLPENLVIDDHSETARLLKNTYESYLKMLESARKKKQEAQAKATIDYHRAAGKLDVLKAVGTKAQGMIEHKLGVIGGKIGLTPDETMRLGNMAVSGTMMAFKGYSIGEPIDGLSDAVQGKAPKPETVSGGDIAKDTLKMTALGTLDGIGIAGVAGEHVEALDGGAKQNRNQKLKQAAQAAAMVIDQSVVDALLNAAPHTLGALEGRIAKQIDIGEMVEAVLAERPQAKTLTSLIGSAMSSALVSVVTAEESRAAFEKAAKKLAVEYASRVNVTALMNGFKFDSHPVDDAFDALTAAATPAAAAVFADTEFLQALDVARSQLLEAASLNNESLSEALERSEEEAEDFERQLVLMDEGGEDMARQRSIAVLIAQLEKDRLDLEIVLKVGSILGTFGGSVVTLGVDSSNFKEMNREKNPITDTGKTLATEVGKSLVPALKAAQLVMQMSVNIIQIAQRAALAGKFEQDVDKARKAGSPLLPAVENFYGAKVAQQHFAKTELALQTVQLAGAICSSVPEPITQGVGRLLTAIGALGKATKDFTKQVYTEAQLIKGWNRTLEGLSNPANRRAGLDALRSNGTLAVHAVAWAATEGGDAIAREILNSCGVNAQTLADSASDQQAVIAYLETRLNEDIKFKDLGQIKTNWAPNPLQLSYAGWFALVTRARRDAVPPLSEVPTTAVASALKLLDVQPKVEVMLKSPLDFEESDLRTWLQQCEDAKKQLKAFAPTTPDNTPHTDMLRLCGLLAEMAETRVAQLTKLIATVVAVHRNAKQVERWQEDVKRLLTMQARDALIVINRIEVQFGNEAPLTSENWPESVGEISRQLLTARERVLAGLRMQAERDSARWIRECDEAVKGGLTGAKLLKVLHQVDQQMAQLKANLLACNVADIDLSKAETARGTLEVAYKSQYPQSTVESEVVDVREGDKPTLTDELGAAALFESKEVAKNWFTLKKLYKARTVTEEAMQQAWAYRQKIVDKYMNEVITTRYGLKRGSGWIAVGSVTMESDIDITILDHHWSDKEPREILKTDAQIVDEFNRWFMGEFGAQPGIMFDVNLYASAPPRRPLVVGEDATPVQKAMGKMKTAGQDVGALMKVRRFMNWEEYQAYMEEVLAEMRKNDAPEDAIDATIQQFEEADSLYQMQLSVSLEKARDLINKVESGKRTPEQVKALEMIVRELDRASTASGNDGQKILLEASKKLEHMQDVAMWVNNELYTAGISEVREIEAELDLLQKRIDDGEVTAEEVADEIAGKSSRLKTLATDSIFFANEAYQSEGPFKHIVVAVQSTVGDVKKKFDESEEGAELKREGTGEERKKELEKLLKQQIAEETKRRIDGLPIDMFLQSFNEQLGDLLKDLDHYASEDNPGMGFYRSSKYLQRLLDAFNVLNDKLGGNLTASLPFTGDPVALSTEVGNTLLAARKGKVAFKGELGPDQIELELQAYAIQKMNAMFGVDTLAGVSALFKKLGTAVNAKARAAMLEAMRLSKEEQKLQKAYFSGTEKK